VVRAPKVLAIARPVTDPNVVRAPKVAVAITVAAVITVAAASTEAVARVAAVSTVARAATRIPVREMALTKADAAPTMHPHRHR